VLVSSPSYLARRGVPHPADLATHDGLLMTDVDGKRDIWKLITPEEGIFRVKINSKIESNFGELLRDAAVYGRGISSSRSGMLPMILTPGACRLSCRIIRYRKAIFTL
jgi:DNA-binding transcriptional LysR family regulator